MDVFIAKSVVILFSTSQCTEDHVYGLSVHHGYGDDPCLCLCLHEQHPIAIACSRSAIETCGSLKVLLDHVQLFCVMASDC